MHIPFHQWQLPTRPDTPDNQSSAFPSPSALQILPRQLQAETSAEKRDLPDVFLFDLSSLQNSPHGYNGTISRRTCSNSYSRTLRMYNLTAAHINRHMSRIADQIPRLCVGIADCFSAALQRRRTMGQADAKMGKYAHHKSRTVRSVCQACSTPYIGIAYKLAGIGNNAAAADICGISGIGTAA